MSGSDVDLTALVPCAGVGRRFGADYPKELHPCGTTGTTVLDRALAPVVAFARDRGARVRVVTVIGAHKAATVAHLGRYASCLDLVFVYQGPQHPAELRGAVAAGLPLCAGPTALVLPDQVVRDPHADARFAAAVDLLAEHPVAVLAAAVADPARLATEGALRLDRTGRAPRVAMAADKPADPSSYDAAWVTLLTTAAERRRLAGLTTALDELLVGAPAVLVDDFVNVNRPGDLT